MASLFVMQGRDRGKRFELPAELTLGRDNSNLIQLNDSEVSRQHARVRKEEAGFVLTDLQPLALVAQSPVGFGSPLALFEDQPMGRAQFVNALDHRVRRRDELVLQIL